MSETVTLIIMLSLFYTIVALENHDFELVKLVKRQNEDITLHCSLSENHEEFNKNTSVNWYYLRTCKYCAFNSLNPRKEEWQQVDCNGSCKIRLTLDNSNASEGFYKCKIFPYHTNYRTVLQIEITKVFQIELAENSNNGLPEILDTQNKFKVVHNSQTVLQCKCRSNKQKPTIKWFRQKSTQSDDNDEDSSITYIESRRAIKYFENFYQPITSSGLKELDDHMYLSKLIINNITEDSIYVCVAINYFGFVYKDFLINIERIDIDEEDSDYESNDNSNNFDMSHNHDDKSFELFLIPLLLLVVVIIQISTIIYLMIYRSIMKETNKHFV
ncbi:unnamed protein product [Chironomus riparius]|uniref:Ig-like domain-containing protein n=1 Tax=Chironomus riparius TaxID=315576 RepID=A0A9P0NM65_9DIPT|nr:unnamed protein product [Chironomus riparius]